MAIENSSLYLTEFFLDHYGTYSQFIDKYINSEVRNPLVVNAFLSVNRANFLPHSSWKHTRFANNDKIIPLGENGRNNISQPSLLGKILDFTYPDGSGSLLEIGANSGYFAALAACCYEQVDTIEIESEIALQTTQRLSNLGYDNISVYCQDGLLIPPPKTEYKAIVVSATLKTRPIQLEPYLSEGGILIAPIGEIGSSQLTLFQKHDNQINSKGIGMVRFEPAITELTDIGWTPDEYENYRALVAKDKEKQATRNIVADMAEALGLKEETLIALTHGLFDNAIGPEQVDANISTLTQWFLASSLRFMIQERD